MATPEAFRAILAANSLPIRIDFSHKAKNLCENINELLYKLAHEPSLAGHRIQEHVYKTVPSLIREKAQVISNAKNLNGVMFDIDYTDNFLNQLDESTQNCIETRAFISDVASKISSHRSQNNVRN